MPKDVVSQATQLQGGELEARGMCTLPRNRQQIANYRRDKNKKDENVLYSVMLECKEAQGSKESFVRDVKAAPDPQCVTIGNSQTWNAFWQIQPTSMVF